MFSKHLKLTDSALRTKNINYLLLPHDVDFSAVWKMLNDESYAILVERNEGKIVKHWIVYQKDLMKFYQNSQ